MNKNWITADEWEQAYIAYLVSDLVSADTVDLFPDSGLGIALFENLVTWHSGLSDGALALLGNAASPKALDAVNAVMDEGLYTGRSLNQLHYELTGLTAPGQELEGFAAAVEGYYADVTSFCDSTTTRAAATLALDRADAPCDTGAEMGVPASYLSRLLLIMSMTELGALHPVNELPFLIDPNADYDGDGIINKDELSSIPTEATRPDNSNTDGDGLDDLDDPCPVDPENKCNMDEDEDNDGLIGFFDNCPTVYNPNQLDSDDDGVGDVCDICPGESDSESDSDKDGICWNTDNCPDISNHDQEDQDSDGRGDVCDVCPNDNTDDIDSDGICEDVDNCPGMFNDDQADFDGDGIGDVCDDDNDYPIDFIEQTKLIASDGASNYNFGDSVSISDDTAIVGARQSDGNSITSGSAYIFYRDHGGADNWGQVKKLIASDGAFRDYFGSSVSISEDIVIIGSWGDDDNGNDSGSAYIYYRDHGGPNNWGQVKKLTASDGVASDLFGRSVSISGDYAIVGAIWDDDKGSNSGSAYIFFRNQGGVDNWGQVKKLTAGDGSDDDRFGDKVSMSGDTVIVSAYQDDDKGSNSGSAYIFSRNQGGANNWGEVQKLTASDGVADDQFGNGVSISGDSAIVGARGDDDNGSSSGSAYIFSRNQGGADNWGEVQKLTASDGAADDNLGFSVAISGSKAIVGARWDDDKGSNSGSAYIFSRNQGGADNWGEVQKLTASDGAADDQFGWSVMINRDLSIVGAYWDDDTGSNSGSAYVYVTLPPLPDSDGDGIPDGDGSNYCTANNIIDCDDNCMGTYNPDQRDVDSDGMGDVCDICPDDNTDTCNADRSGGSSYNSNGGSLSTPDQTITMNIPAGAINIDTSISITDSGESFALITDLGDAEAIYGVTIHPEGQVFNTPVTLVFSWDDADNDGFVDFTAINEENLRISKDNVVITDRCINEAGCDMAANTFTFQVSSLSEFVLVDILCDDDLDGDGIMDDGDCNGTVGDNYCTGGDTSNCDDNCIEIANPDQADTNSDGIGNACELQHVSGSGMNYPIPGFSASLSLDVISSSLETGWLNYYYSRLRLSLQSASITGITVNGSTVTITGEGTANGVPGYTFEVTITDGNPDQMEIVIYKPDSSIYFQTGPSDLVNGDFIIETYSTIQYDLITDVDPPGAGGLSPDCSTVCSFDGGTIVTLTATANTGYSFYDWTGCDSSSNNVCTMTMDTDENVTANFGTCLSPIRLDGTTPVSSLQQAVDSAEDGASIIIQTQAQTLTENLVVNNNITVMLLGGYDCGYGAVIGNTNLIGNITVNNGTVVIEDFILNK